MKAEDNEGPEVRFGDAKAMLAMIRLLAERRGLGGLLAGGVHSILKVHPEWAAYLMHSKGLTFPAYDPRGFNGMGLAYATSSRGACHNVGGCTVSDELLKPKVNPLPPRAKLAW